MFRTVHLLAAMLIFVSTPATLASSPVAGSKVGCIRALIEQVLKNDFTVNRGLEDYSRSFGKSFTSNLKSLKKNQVWIDFGAGHGSAQIQYQMKGETPFSYGKAKTIAISLKRPPADEYVKGLINKISDPTRFEYREGTMIEDMSSSEIGEYDLGSDFFGPLSYSTRMSETLEKYFFNLKKKTGRLFVVVSKLMPGTKEFEYVKNGKRTTNVRDILDHETFVITLSGRKMTFADWISKLPGITVKETRIMNGSRPSQNVSLEIRRNMNSVQVPKLELESLTSESPPGRIFREISE